MVNEDVRMRVFVSGITYRQIAVAMGCRYEYLSRIMCKPLSDKNRKKVLDAIYEVENRGTEREDSAIMPKVEFMNVDETKLRLLLIKKGLRLSEASIKIGRTDQYLNTTLRRYNALPRQVTKLIDKFIGIKYEEYALPDNVDNSSIQDDNSLTDIYREMRTLSDTCAKIYDQLNQIIEVNQALLKKHIGLEETIFKGSKRALDGEC